MDVICRLTFLNRSMMMVVAVSIRYQPDYFFPLLFLKAFIILFTPSFPFQVRRIDQENVPQEKS